MIGSLNAKTVTPAPDGAIDGRIRPGGIHPRVSSEDIGIHVYVGVYLYQHMDSIYV